MIDIFEKYEQIYDNKSKMYFKEVLSSYNNNNYRSAIVMLYSVVIYDIVAKIKELDEIYNQSWAKRTLQEINKIRNANPKSPEWEKQLIDQVASQRDFLSLSTVEAINHLREIRNQCAHPSIDNNDELFMPSRYEADALISRMLNEVLTIPAMFTNKITDYITEQISKIAGYSQFKWTDQSKLTKSFNKYFNRMNDNVYIKVFKDMWKLTFFTANDECDKNRFANMIFLDIMLSQRHSLLLETLKNEKDYFNKISSNPEVNKYLSILIYRNNYLLAFIDDTTKTLIKNSKYDKLDIQLFAWFAFDNVKEYIDNLCHEKSLHNNADTIIDIYKQENALIDFKEYFKNQLINIYIGSTDFNSADKNFDDFVYPLIEDLTKEDVINIIRLSETNPQLTRRYSFIKKDDRGNKLLELVNKFNITLEDVEAFPHFKKFFETSGENNTSNSNIVIDEDELPF